jgi:hypothetical protein
MWAGGGILVLVLNQCPSSAWHQIEKFQLTMVRASVRIVFALALRSGHFVGL